MFFLHRAELYWPHEVDNARAASIVRRQYSDNDCGALAEIWLAKVARPKIRRHK
jgi:hypothetical protein